MSATVQLDVPLLLPEVNDHWDRCVVHLVSELRAAPGVTRVHMPAGGGALRLCIHHDPAVISAAEIERLARSEGARMTARIGHLLWAVDWIDDERSARGAREALRGLAGVLGAEVNRQGIVRVEYNRRRVDAGAIERSLHELGLARGRSSGATQERRDRSRSARRNVRVTLASLP